MCTKIFGAAFAQPRKSNQKRSEAMAVNYYLAPHKNKAGEQPVRISIAATTTSQYTLKVSISKRYAHSYHIKMF